MPSWPGSLPTKPLERGYEETGQEPIVRTEMDQGPPKVRRRFTSPVIQFTALFVLDKTDLATLMTFYSGDAGYGAVAFTWSHPRTEAGISARFVNRPQVSAVANGYYEASCVFEVLP